MSASDWEQVSKLVRNNNPIVDLSDNDVAMYAIRICYLHLEGMLEPFKKTNGGGQ